MKSNLQAGWHWGKVSDLYDAVKITVDPTTADTLPYIGLEHLSKGGGIEAIGNSEDLKSIKTAFQAGDVLYGKLRPYLNKHTVVDFEGVCSTDILAFRSKRGYASHLLNHYLGLPSVIQYANEHSKGINLPRVNAGALLDMDIPIPPMNEANRIIAQLEATMQKLEASQERLEKLPVLLKKFRQAVLAAAVSGKLTEAWRGEQPQGETAADLLDRIRAERRAQWEVKQIAKMKGKQLSLNDSWKQKYEEPIAPDASELPELPDSWVWTTMPTIGELNRGKSKHRPRNDEALYGGPYPFIQTGDISRANRIIDTYKQTYSELGLEQSKLWSKGTLCITIAANIADTAILGFDACFPDSVVGFLANSEVVEIDFVEFFISTAKANIEHYAPATAQKNINLEILSQVAIPLPPFEEQQEIVRQVNHYFELADQLEARFEQAAALVEQLPQALLAKAFSGQLVPQDPNDEPASALLERLEAKVAPSAKGKRGRKPKAMADAPLFE